MDRPPNPSSHSLWRSPWTQLALMLLAMGIMYGHTLAYPFVFDDNVNIINPSLELKSLSIKGVKEVLTGGTLTKRPVANLSFALNYYADGYRPAGFRLVNMAIHLVNAVLVYVIALRIFRHMRHRCVAQIRVWKEQDDHALALAGAWLWFAHPVHVQSVVYTVQRMNSLAAMFYLLSFAAYLQARTIGVRYPVRWGAVAVLFWGAALGSKEIAIVLPVAVCLYEWMVIRDLDFAWLKRHAKFACIPLALIVGISLFWVGNPIDTINASYAKRDFTLIERMLTQGRVVVFYVSQLLLPLPGRLNLDHHFVVSTALWRPLATSLALLLLIALALAVGIARRQRLLAMAICWWFVHLALESSVLGLELAFEHRSYLPSVLPVFAVTVLSFCHLPSRCQKPLLFAVIITCLGLTRARTHAWDSELSLWQDCALKSPQKARSHYNLGVALGRAEQPEAARKAYKQAVELDEQYGDAWHNLGLACDREGDLTGAIACYKKAAAANPKNADSHYNLGVNLAKAGRIADAKSSFEAAVAAKPDHGKARFNLGKALVELNQVDAAIVQFKLAIASKTAPIGARIELARALIKRRKTEAAIEHMRELIAETNPPIAHLMMAKAYTVQGDSEQAMKILSELVSSQPEFLDGHIEIGVAFARTGQMTAAVAAFEKAWALAPAALKVGLNLANAYRDNKQLDKAVAVARKLVETHPNAVDAYLRLAELLERGKNIDASTAAIQVGLARQPTSVKLLDHAGRFYFRHDQLELAERNWLRLLELRPKRHVTHANIGHIMMRQQQPSAAIVHYQRALALRPAARVYNNMAAALLQLGKAREAVKAYKAALRIEPNYVEAKENLALALAQLREAEDVQKTGAGGDER